MDKYEYKLKLEQLNALVEAKDYKTAAQIASDINWKKVKSVATLCMVGEIFERTHQYDISREVLLMAYDRSPVGRNIIYRLTLVALKMKNLEEAQEYYEEFIEIAPHDNMKYVLKYEIARARGVDTEELISILEEFKEREYTEEWAFELAYLYHRCGKADKCVEICDELILWFGEGSYVEKALELKMMYQPLNKLQEDKYRRIKGQEDSILEGVTEVSPRDIKTSGAMLSNTVRIPSIHADTGKFNTVNLQAELMKGMQQIMEATETEMVTDAMDNIKKMVGDMPSLYQEEEPEEPEELGEPGEVTKRYGPIGALDEGLEEPAVEDPALNIDFQSILSEEYDGQISLKIPEAPKPDLQITGQMSIEDILAEWERTKEAARVAIAEAEQRKLEQAKARALQQAENILEQLNEIELEPEIMPEIIYEMEDGTAEEVVPEPGIEAGPEEEGEAPETAPKTGAGIAGPEHEEGIKRAVSKLGESIKEAVSELEEEVSKKSKLMPEVPEQRASPEETERTAHPEGAEYRAAQEAERMTYPEGAEYRAAQEAERMTYPEGVEYRTSQEAEKIVQPEGPREPLTKLTEEQRQIFTYFTMIGGMEQQLCQALQGVKDDKMGRTSSDLGNLAILGGRGSGKTVLATDFIKAYQQFTGQKGKKVGKISATVLNQKDIDKLFEAVGGGYLIIEQAGELSQETVELMADLMQEDTGGLMVILEDERKGIDKVMSRKEAFANMFTESIRIPVFTNDELVLFAKAYAREKNCEIEDMGILALYNSISNIQKVDEATTLSEVKEIMDDAIGHASRGGLKKLFGGKRTTEEGLVLIKEKDFE